MNPFLSVWMRPRETIRHIVETDPSLHVHWLASATGIVSALDKASEKNIGDHYSLPVILLYIFILGPAGGILSLYFSAWLLRVSGRWLGGEADSESLRAAFAWSSIPNISTLIIWVPMALILGGDLFKENLDRLDDQLFLSILLLGLIALGVAALIWGGVIACNMVAEVQGFRSAWKGLLNFVLAGALVLVPILGIGLAVFLVFKAFTV